MTAPINSFFQPHLEVGSGQAQVRLTVREDFFHSAGAMHGAVYFKALDDATYFAAQSMVEDRFILTAHFEIDLLQPVVGGVVRARSGDRGHRAQADRSRRVARRAGRMCRPWSGRFCRRSAPAQP